MTAQLAGEVTPDAAPGRRRSRPRTVLTWLVDGGALLGALVLAGHRFVPNVLGVGSLMETFLPWLGLVVLPLGLAALLLRSVTAGVALAVLVAVWAVTFGPLLLPRGPGGGHDMRIVSHNVWMYNPRLVETAQALIATDADVVSVQELRPEWLDRFAAPMDRAYPYHQVVEGFGVWSRYRISGAKAVETGIGTGYRCALRMVLATPRGPLVLYDVHLISPMLTRRGFGGWRDETLRRLTEQIEADRAGRIVLAGDLNTAPTDRRMRRLTQLLRPAQATAGHGFGFTWPARLPVARIDHLLTHGVTVTDTSVLARTGSDHRPVQVDLRF